MPASISVGGERVISSHALRVPSASYFTHFCDQASNASKPSSLPCVAAQIAIPMRFHSPHPSSGGLGMIASAARTLHNGAGAFSFSVGSVGATLAASAVTS